MELDGAQVGHEQELLGRVGHQHLVDVAVLGLDGATGHPVRSVVWGVLLIEVVAVDSVGHPFEGEGAVTDVTEDRFGEVPVVGGEGHLW